MKRHGAEHTVPPCLSGLLSQLCQQINMSECQKAVSATRQEAGGIFVRPPWLLRAFLATSLGDTRADLHLVQIHTKAYTMTTTHALITHALITPTSPPPSLQPHL